MSFKDLFYANVAVKAALWLVVIGYVLSMYMEVEVSEALPHPFTCVLVLIIGQGVFFAPFVCGWIYVRCPHCSQSVRVYARKRKGMWVECPNCGITRGEGVRLTREPLPPKADDEESGEE